MKKRLGIFLLLATAVLAFDQGTKYVVLTHFMTTYFDVTPFFNIRLVWNEGISFGLLGNGLVPALVLIGIGVVIISMLLIWLFRPDSEAIATAISIVTGGAIGNIIDRIRFGAVVDFLDFHIGNWHWPAFNIADACIVIGIAFILFDSLFLERKRKA